MGATLVYRTAAGTVAVFTPAPQARLVAAIVDTLDPVPVRRRFDPPLSRADALVAIGGTEEDVDEGRLILTFQERIEDGPDGERTTIVECMAAEWFDRTEPRLTVLDPPLPAYRALRDRGRGWRHVLSGELLIEWAESEEEQVARAIPRAVPAGALNARTVAATDLPGREFREAWTLPVDGPPVVDLDRAKAIQMARIRRARDAHSDWPRIDADRARAIETGDDALLADVHARATVLRNLPEVAAAELDTAKIAAEIAAVWPPPLPPREGGS